MSVLAADSMAGGYGSSVDCSNPYLNKDTFHQCTQDGVVYDNGGYNQGGGYDQGGYNDSYNNGNNYDNGNNYGDGYNDGYGNDGYNNGGQQYEEPTYVDNRYTRSYQETYQTCDPRRDPHSYACAKATFAGDIFPLFDLRWRRLQGEWITVTYANPSGNFGDEFFMATNPASPTQPMGVYNVNTNSPVGSMWIDGDRMVFNNWQGQTIQTVSFSKVTDKTAVLTMQEGNYVHQFTCRDFNRNDKHHLFCAWDVEVPGYGWIHHGYMGFLSRADWDGFLRNGVRQ